MPNNSPIPEDNINDELKHIKDELKHMRDDIEKLRMKNLDLKKK